MKPLKIGIGVSFLFHLAVFIFCYFYFLPIEEPRTSEVIISWGTIKTSPKIPISNTKQNNTLETKLAEKQFSALRDENNIMATAMDTIINAEPDSHKLFFFSPESYSKFWFRTERLQFSREDSLSLLASRPLSLLAPKGSPVRFDRIGNDIYQRNHGQPPLLPLDALMNGLSQVFTTLSRKERESIRLSSLPSQEEIATLAAIYHLGRPTQAEIYAFMDSSIHMTAQDLDVLLAELTLKGYIELEIISPRDEIQIMTPMKTIGIEKSALNRRNRVYRYTAILERQHLMNFLQAQWYQQKNGGAPETVKRIEHLIYLLLPR